MAGVMEHGICRLAIVPVRTSHTPVSDQTSQLLFGDHYEVLKRSSDKQSLFIRIHADQFEGWIQARQHHAISPEYFAQINQTEYRITTDLVSPVLYRKMPMLIVMGSVVPLSNSELFKVEEQFAFNGESKALGQRRDAEYVAATARKYLLAPESRGGKTPFGMDAAGLLQMVFRISGYHLQRELAQQAMHGKKLKGLADANPGDLVFFGNPSGQVVHGGILLEEGRVIHVHGHVRVDRLEEDGLHHMESGQMLHPMHSLRRLL